MIVKLKIGLSISIIIVLGIIGIIGYSINAKGKPIRVLFKTKGGPVIFTHKSHSEEYEEDCTRCHHGIESENNDEIWKCRTCHIAGSDYEFICEDRPVHKQCIGANCIDCHEEYGVDEGNCSFCHRK